MSFTSFADPFNILGIQGFQGQITYGSGGWSWGFPDRASVEYWNRNWLNDLPYWIIYTPERTYEEPIPLVDRRDTPADPEVPMGSSNIQSLPPDPGVELSDLVISEAPVPLPRETTVPLSAQQLIDKQWFETLHPGKTYVPVGQLLDVPSAAQPTEIQMAEDLFGDLGDLGVEWIRSQLGLAPTGQIEFVSGAVEASAAPAAVTAPTAAACGTGASPVYKKVCGVYKWVYPKRRRRRALLTNGDYNDLLRIENLKVNKNMSVAIAKALTR